tara:strand:- start:162 stop:356 length:195 start_codon:yes stop_codon:yes gene_type:complete
MKFKIPFLAVLIVGAILFINKDEVKNMFNKGEDAVICENCVNECPCVEVECICKNTCKCPKCVA